jgi:uncharacterized protein (DUF2252 family)
LADRPEGFDPVGALLERAATREPTLVPLLFSRMAADEFSFLRGSAILQAIDLAAGASSGLEVQLCGDAHLANFGVFLSPERRLVFDVDDFDETASGPFEWDVKRLATSVAVAASAIGLGGLDRERVVAAVASGYRTSMREFALKSALDVWFASLDVAQALVDLRGFFSDERMTRIGDVILAARGASTARAYERITQVVDGEPRFSDLPPLLVPLDRLGAAGAATRPQLDEILVHYAQQLESDRRALLAQFTPVDAARKVVGIGSVATRCYAILLIGRDAGDLFCLQVKEAGRSVLDVARALDSPTSGGERVVRGQRLLQATPDLFLGWGDGAYADGGSRSFYLRQLYDGKAAVAVGELETHSLEAYARACAWTLARPHARGGRPVEVAGYLGGSTRFDDAIVEFALAAAAQNATDHLALRRAIDDKRVPATP